MFALILQIEARSVEHMKSVTRGLENKIIELQQKLDEKVGTKYIFYEVLTYIFMSCLSLLIKSVLAVTFNTMHSVYQAGASLWYASLCHNKFFLLWSPVLLCQLLCHSLSCVIMSFIFVINKFIKFS